MQARGYLSRETGIGILTPGPTKLPEEIMSAKIMSAEKKIMSAEKKNMSAEKKNMSAEKKIGCWLAAFTVLVAAAAMAAAAPGYKVVNTFRIGGEGGWDYLTA